MTYDVIIIGSGIGGLTCASVLSSLNKKVLVIEKNKIPGGCMQPVTVEDEEKIAGKWQWSLGMQYVCGYGKNSLYNIPLQILTDYGVKFSKLNTQFQFVDFYNATENRNLLKKEFKSSVFANSKLMENQLIKDFPNEKKNIKRYYRYLNSVNRKVLLLTLAKFFPIGFAKFIYPVILRVFFPIMSIRLKPLHEISIKEVVEKRIKITDEHLKRILFSYWHIIGMPIEKSPFLFYAVAQKMVASGIYFPNGGTKSITDAYIKTINNNSGIVECNKEVKEIIIENDKATGIELINGDKIYASEIISSAGIAETIQNIIPKEKWNKQIITINQISEKKIPPTCSVLILRVGLEGDISKYNIQKTTYRYIVGDSSQMHGDPTHPNWLPPDLTYIFLSKYDDSHNSEKYHYLDIIQFTKFSYFENIKYPSQEYNEVENRITAAILAKFDERFSGITKLVKFTTLTSPLSIIKDTSHFKGSIFGRNIKKAGYPNIQPRVGIKNLYITGEDVFSPGITVFNGIISSIVVGGFFKTIWMMFKKWRKLKKTDK